MKRYLARTNAWWGFFMLMVEIGIGPLTEALILLNLDDNAAPIATGVVGGVGLKQTSGDRIPRVE